MTTEFADKLLAAMRMMENPKKDKTAQVPTKSGGKYTYKYTQLDDVLGVIRPPLLENGLVLLQGVTHEDRLECVVSDGECSVTLDSRAFKPTGDPQSQGSYETYMRRYQLLTAFGLCGEDDDGAAASTKRQQPQQQQRRQEPQAVTQTKPMWDQVLDTFYGKCNEYGYNSDSVWSQLISDVGFVPTPSITDSEFKTVMAWLSRVK